MDERFFIHHACMNNENERKCMEMNVWSHELEETHLTFPLELPLGCTRTAKKYSLFILAKQSRLIFNVCPVILCYIFCTLRLEAEYLHKNVFNF